MGAHLGSVSGLLGGVNDNQKPGQLLLYQRWLAELIELSLS